MLSRIPISYIFFCFSSVVQFDLWFYETIDYPRHSIAVAVATLAGRIHTLIHYIQYIYINIHMPNTQRLPYNIAILLANRAHKLWNWNTFYISPMVQHLHKHWKQHRTAHDWRRRIQSRKVGDCIFLFFFAFALRLFLQKTNEWITAVRCLYSEFVGIVLNRLCTISFAVDLERFGCKPSPKKETNHAMMMNARCEI